MRGARATASGFARRRTTPLPELDDLEFWERASWIRTRSIMKCHGWPAKNEPRPEPQPRPSGRDGKRDIPAESGPRASGIDHDSPLVWGARKNSDVQEPCREAGGNAPTSFSGVDCRGTRSSECGEIHSVERGAKIAG